MLKRKPEITGSIAALSGCNGRLGVALDLNWIAAPMLHDTVTRTCPFPSVERVLDNPASTFAGWAGMKIHNPAGIGIPRSYRAVASPP